MSSVFRGRTEPIGSEWAARPVLSMRIQERFRSVAQVLSFACSDCSFALVSIESAEVVLF